MEVVSVIFEIEYEGSDFCGVFASHGDALAWIESNQKSYGQYGLIKSKIGQGFTPHDCPEIEWL